MATGMKTYTYGPESGRKPDRLVVLLHGYGSNGEDLIGLAPYWSRLMPDAIFVSPDAPFECEAGFGYQWFSLRQWTPMAMLGGAEAAAPILNHFLDQTLAEYGLTDNQLALVGFSQGTMMSLYAAPRRARAIAGVLGYSGALIGGEGLVGNSATVKMPVHLIHGDFDTVVPVAAYYHATATLVSAGYTVTGNVTSGLVHSIDEAGIESGGQFLKKVLYP